MLREAELRWLENGEARLLAGATGRHPAGVAGMRSPRGAACLTRSDASTRAWEGRRRQRAGVGWAVASELGRGEGAGTVRSAGPASADGPEVRRRPVK